VSEDIVRLVVNPVRTASSPISHRGKLPVVAKLTIDEVVVTVIDSVVREEGLTHSAGCTLLVVALVLRGDSFIEEDLTRTTGAILLRVIRLDQAGIAGLEIHITWAILRPVFFAIAHFAVKTAIRSVIVVERIKQGMTFDTAETVLVVPLPIGSDHLLCLIHPALALRTAVLVVLLCLDDPGFYGGASEHVIVIVIEF